MIEVEDSRIIIEENLPKIIDMVLSIYFEDNKAVLE